MTRAPGIVIICGLLVLLALRLFGSHPGAPTNLGRVVLTSGYLALGVVSLITASALWRGSPKAFLLFVVWSFTYLAIGGAVQVITDGAGLGAVAIWVGFVGAVLLAVGAHVRYVRRQAV
jgi:hypothetical protein